MKSKELGETDPWRERNFVVVLEDGDEAFGAITRFAEKQKLVGASLTAIGAFRSATLGFFDFKTKSYKEIPVDYQTEVLSAIGDVAVGDDGKVSLHMHVVLGMEDGSTKGGHFIKGTVHPTLEIMVRESSVGFRRRKREELGIALIDV
ncbi:DNA-binding protein [Rhizobium sp. S152]|uniref:PPC domain-containing DNA-binding protein n=1 Tax=Rhizobium sp. S152 TaxID=3055038 RepID=UPI0025A9FAC4|nr:PPC domain-containing DNA-binding protein [Rhizobium sp. S152]MDM9627755.1 DNA-binding protein [Rhizobium sp. S152]